MISREILHLDEIGQLVDRESGPVQVEVAALDQTHFQFKVFSLEILQEWMSVPSRIVSQYRLKLEILFLPRRY